MGFRFWGLGSKLLEMELYIRHEIGEYNRGELLIKEDARSLDCSSNVLTKTLLLVALLGANQRAF